MIKGVGAALIGLRAAAFLDFRIGFAGGNITNLRSATTGIAFGFGIVEVTEIVVEDPDVEVCNFAGNGLPGAFLADFLANFGLTIFDDRPALFLADFFTIGFLALLFWAAAFAGFFAFDFVLFFALFLKNFLIATLPPGGAKVMAWLN